MTNTTRFPNSHDEEPETTRYASFIVRCWQDSEARLRVRLIDVNSDVSYPVSHLNELPAVLRRLLRRMSFQTTDDEAQNGHNRNNG